MAGAGFKNFTTGEVLTASDVQGYLMDQSVMVFAGTAARASAIPSPSEGMVTYRSDDDAVEVYDGSAWVGLGGVGAAVISSPAATGSYSSGGTTYNYYEFTASGTLTVDTAGFADVLVVGGGGSGGTGNGGGGGAGGHLYSTNVYIPSGSHTITVGAGGPAPGISSYGFSGITSQIGNLYFGVGGGGGGRTASLVARDAYGVSGGSGGGAGGVNSALGGAGVSGQGYAGGNGVSSYGGGGGGSASAGTNGTSSNNNAGGSGTSTSITGSAVTRAAGGTGDASSASSGSANTGDGGGGSDASAGPAGAGGSGIVIVRVAV